MEKNENNKKLIILILKCILVVVVGGILTTLFHMINSRYILHIHGKPEFVSDRLIIFSACSRILTVVGYLMLGYKIPIKNSIIRGIAYMGFNWASNFVPQFMGLAFGDGPIAEQVFVLSDLICDSIVYVLIGILLGVLFGKKSYEKKDDNLHKLIKLKPVLISAVTFPLVVIILDQLMAAFIPEWSSLVAMKISEEVKMQFYINFYAWFILSGAFISIFYQVTDYRDKDNRSWFRFAMKYSLLLWTPVVMIMVIFGTEIIATSIFNILFLISITVLCWINSVTLKNIN